MGKNNVPNLSTNKVLENKNLKNETVSWGITVSDVASKTNKSDVSAVNIYHVFKRRYELGHHLVPMGHDKCFFNDAYADMPVKQHLQL